MDALKNGAARKPHIIQIKVERLSRDAYRLGKARLAELVGGKIFPELHGNELCHRCGDMSTLPCHQLSA